MFNLKQDTKYFREQLEKRLNITVNPIKDRDLSIIWSCVNDYHNHLIQLRNSHQRWWFWFGYTTYLNERWFTWGKHILPDHPLQWQIDYVENICNHTVYLDEKKNHV